MLIIDFITQIFLASIFFVGILGVGFVILRCFRYTASNTALQLSLAYFLSLCLYTVLLCGSLFLFPNKIIAGVLVTLLYTAASLGVLVYYHSKAIVDFVGNIKLYKQKEYLFVAAVFVVSFFCFFLQNYHTAILDEYLHRPVVQSFVENGVFPLVNPLEPQKDFIHVYHYGTQMGAAMLQIIFHTDTPTALDLYKFANFIGTFLLLWGLVYHWSGRKKNIATIGTFFTLFASSSFFFLDAFTTSHFINFQSLNLENAGSRPMNYPLMYSLSGLTWVNIPLTIAFSFFIEDLFKKKWKGNLLAVLLLVLISAGLFLISEFFAAVLLSGTLLLSAIFLFQNRHLSWQFVWKGGALLLATLLLVAFVGGPVGHIVKVVPMAVMQKFSPTQPEVTVVPDPVLVTEEVVVATTPGILSLRPASEWGYPGERRVYLPLEVPFYYLRSMLLEIAILILAAYLLVKRRVSVMEHPLFIYIIAFGVVVPFIFSTSFGDLNLAKATEVAFICVRLLFFWLLVSAPIQKGWKYLFFTLFVLGTISPVLIGVNIQTEILSSKGRSQYCSQNPLCYSEDDTDLYTNFEKMYPGLKKVVVLNNQRERVVDLSNSYAVATFEKKDISAEQLATVIKQTNAQFIIGDADNVLLKDIYQLELRNGKRAIFSVTVKK